MVQCQIMDITEYFVELRKNSGVAYFKLYEDIYINDGDIHFKKYSHLNYLWEYFYTQEEIRIKKLDSL